MKVISNEERRFSMNELLWGISRTSMNKSPGRSARKLAKRIDGVVPLARFDGS